MVATTTHPSGSGSLGRGEESPIQNTGPVISAPLHVSDNAPPRIINLKSANPFELPRSTGSALPQRPSTSGGPASRRVVTEHTTQDDLHFNPLTANRVASPILLPSSSQPASVPTLEVTPPSSTQVPLKRESSSELLIADLVEMNARALGIGMALGSPSQVDNSAASWPLPLVPEVHHETAITLDAMPDYGSKHKGSKWKRFFGVKKAATPSTYYQARSEDVNDFDSGKAARPSTKRANTAPVFNQRRQAQKDKNGRTLTAPPEFLEGEPMLRVDIPTIRMERYSVMFGSVLQSGSSDSQQAGLLARRQATLDKLKTVNEAIAAKEREEAEFLAELKRPRRATSPQPGSTPTFSLFPSTPNAKASPQQNYKSRTHMQRSFTSPSTLSPHMETFTPSSSQKETHVVMLASTPPHSGEQPFHGNQKWGPDESHLMLSPTSMSDEEGFPDEKLPRAPFAEQDWAESRSRDSPQPSSSYQQSAKTTPRQRARGTTLTSSTSSTSSSDATPQHYVFSPFASPPAPIQTGRPTTADEAEVAAAISIARQISVSQRQRQLLIPIKTPKGYTYNGTVRMRTESPSSRPSPEILVGAGADIIGEKKPATPTLTVVTEQQKSNHRHRKSERVILECV